jgi:hypothetical protein
MLLQVTQGNTAKPTGDGTATPITNGVGTTAIASTVKGGEATGTATGATATATKKNSADKALASSGGLAFVMIFIHLLL